MKPRSSLREPTAYGVPRSIGFDNDKSLVKKPDVYIAELSAAMRELCDYYGIDPSSCRIKKPSHKGVVEGSCGIIEKEAYVDLEGFTGYMYAKDLDDVNQKLRDKVDSINEKPFVINGKGYLRSVFNSESSTAITNYKKVMGIKGLCKKHGAKIVDEGCKVAAEANQTSNYELIKSYIIDSIYKINEKKSKYKVDKDKDYPKESGKSEVGVKLRGAESYSGGAQHE